MKRLTTVLMIVIAMICSTAAVDAKTTKKKGGSKKQTNVVAKAKILDTDGCDTFTLTSKGDYTWGGCDSGTYIVSDGAYILLSSHVGVYVLWNDKCYYINFDTPDVESLLDWLASNGYFYSHKLNQVFSFDSASGNLHYTIDGQSGNIDVRGLEGAKITWIKK